MCRLLTNLIEKCPDIVNEINKLTQSKNLKNSIKIHQEFIAGR